jgi:hypothetical protein
MVTQEGGPSSNEGEGNQDRKSLTAAAIRRGDIKISEPILWVEGVPDASTAQRAVSSIVLPEEVGTLEQELTGAETRGVAVSTLKENPEPEPIGNTHTPRHKPPSERVRVSPESQRPITPANQLIEQRNSTVGNSPESSNQMGTKKKRRSGTIRTVFRKVFGRKDKVDSKHISPPESRAGPKHEYTRSVSGFRTLDGTHLLTIFRILSPRLTAKLQTRANSTNHLPEPIIPKTCYEINQWKTINHIRPCRHPFYLFL